MLDRYFIGKVSRISPEAPVQVFDLISDKTKLGGAANVGLNIKTLGSNPYLIGVIGKDKEADDVKKIMIKQGQDTEGLIVEKNRPTTCKTRVIADAHHLLRIDSESKDDISKKTENNIISLLKKIINSIDILILEDYNKGVLTKNLIKNILKIAQGKKIKILVDPKFENFFEYKNVYLFKPNLKELEDAFGKKIKSDSEIISTCKELARKISCKNIVLTLGERGMILFENINGKFKIYAVKTRARKVADVSGAGDTVISTIAVCLAGGATLRKSVEISNFAAGLVVEEVGIVPVDKNALIKYMNMLKSE